jgi:diacylglycerol kinase (ATP)
MASSHRALLILNKHCRRCQTEIVPCVEWLDRHGLPTIRGRTEKPGDIDGFINQHRREIDRIILGGGDGTVHWALEAVLGSGLPLGILPLGTANDLARTLNIPTTLRDACNIILEGRIHRIDLGNVNEKYFLNVAHIGLGEEVTRKLKKEEKKFWGPISYFKSFLSVFRRNRPFAARIACDGHEDLLSSIQVAVGNGRHYGGGMTIEEDAEIDDHVLNLYSLAPIRPWRLPFLASALRKGRFERTESIRFRSCREIVVETKKRMPVISDGELTTETPARFRVHGGILPVFVPEAYLSSRKTGGERSFRHAKKDG